MIREDVSSLAAMARSSARPGELRSAELIAGRLRDIGLGEVEVEGFRYQSGYALAHGLHSLAGIAAVARGGAIGALGGAAVLASYEAEVSGRCQWLRRPPPKGSGANVVGRIPAADRSRGTVVLVAHHDAANTGLVWHPAVRTLGARRHLQAPCGPVHGAGGSGTRARCGGERHAARRRGRAVAPRRGRRAARDRSRPTPTWPAARPSRARPTTPPASPSSST